ncbi:hypothetical protein ABZP36_017428 [Zizania latifolia]
MLLCRGRDVTCLLLLVVVSLLSCVHVVTARPAPATLHQHNHGSLDSAALDKIMSPRSGVGDDGAVGRYSFFPDKPRWSRPSPMVLTYALSPAATVDYLPTRGVRAVFRRAFARWAQTIPVSLVETMNYDAADIKVGFYAGDHGDGDSFDGQLHTLGHATGPEDGHLHLDAAERWALDLRTDKSLLAFDLESVAMHEIGHILGLDHSSSQSAVMYPYIDQRERKVHLTIDDVHGVQALYGANPHFNFTSYDKLDPNTNENLPWILLIWILLAGIIVLVAAVISILWYRRKRINS